jgi:26S proteasome regulatory subunit N10
MRNGDYLPSRLEAQHDAATMIFNAKTQANRESTVGMLTSSGPSGPQVLVTLCDDLGKILQALHRVSIHGQSDIATALQIAQLALKHRQNKNQRQRVFLFVGSPIAEDEKSLVKLAKKLKKNNVAVDVVSFGEWEDNDAKLKSFVENVNSGDNSHLLTVPIGPRIISDVIISSSMLHGEDGVPAAMASAAGGGGSGMEFDPNLDPELALALRLSLEEEKARQEAAARAQQVANGEGASSSAAEAPAENVVPPEQVTEEDVDMDLTEEEQIARAIALSMMSDDQPQDEHKEQ